MEWLEVIEHQQPGFNCTELQNACSHRKAGPEASVLLDNIVRSVRIQKEKWRGGYSSNYKLMLI